MFLPVTLRSPYDAAQEERPARTRSHQQPSPSGYIFLYAPQGNTGFASAAAAGNTTSGF